jgi:hypothetical protein
MERLYRLRDRIAYAIYLRKDLWRKWFLGLAFGLSLFLLVQGLDLMRLEGDDPGWRTHVPGMTVVGIPLVLIAAVSGINRAWVGILTMLLSFEILVAVYVPELLALGTALAVPTFLVWFLMRPQRGALAALLLVPPLEAHFGLGLLAPLGFACFYPIGRAIWMTLTVFVWVLAIGLWRGYLPRFAIGDNGFLYHPTEWLTLTDLKQPPWSQEILEANWERMLRLKELLVGKEEILSPFLIETALAVCVIWIVRTNRRPVRYKDRLALEYLSKEGENVGGEDLVLVRQPLGILAGLGAWVFLQWGLSLVMPGFYPEWLAVGDLCACLGVISLVLLDYHGDPTMPLEFAQDTFLPGRMETPTLTGSSFRIPTPSEMKLQTPGHPTYLSEKREASRIRLRTWKDQADLDWEGTLPDGTRIRPGADFERGQTPPMPVAENVEGFLVGGKVDNQYRIDEVHKGGMGIVYIVTDEFSGVRYAAKTLRDDLRGNGEAVARFTAESKTWIRLGHHPKIVQAMFYREIQGRGLLFLEYVAGTNLEEVYSRPGPRPALAKQVNWGIQVCEGMHYANTKDLGGGLIGLVHRDIKPGNLMLTTEGEIKITDFGLAKAADAPTNLTREKVGLGTLKYMAPEQVKDAKHVDLRADIYSYGAVLYEGLVGHPPFTEEDSINLYMAVLTKDPPRAIDLNPGVPEELDRIVMRCLRKDRDLRYSCFEELGWALRKLDDRLRQRGDTSHLRVVS